MLCNIFPSEGKGFVLVSPRMKQTTYLSSHTSCFLSILGKIPAKSFHRARSRNAVCSLRNQTTYWFDVRERNGTKAWGHRPPLIGRLLHVWRAKAWGRPMNNALYTPAIRSCLEMLINNILVGPIYIYGLQSPYSL